MTSPPGEEGGFQNLPGRRVGSCPGVSSLGPSLASGMQEGESDDAESDGETEAQGGLAQMPGRHWDQPHALPSARLRLRPGSTGPGGGWNGLMAPPARPEEPGARLSGARVHLFDEFVITWKALVCTRTSCSRSVAHMTAGRLIACPSTCLGRQGVEPPRPRRGAWASTPWSPTPPLSPLC